MSSPPQQTQPVVRFSYNGVQGGTVVSPSGKSSSQANYFPSKGQKIRMTTSKLNEVPVEEYQKPVEGKSEFLKNPESSQVQSYRFRSDESGGKNETPIRLEAANLPDAHQEAFKTGFCGKKPITYEAHQKKKSFC